MEETGIVIKADRESALIRTVRSSACESCISRQFCVNTEGADMVIEADNPLNAKVGDKVIFTITPRTMIKAGIIFYLLPLIGFIIGTLAGHMYISPIFPQYNPDIVSALSGIFLLFLTFAVIRLYGRLSSSGRVYKPRIEHII